MHERGAQSKLQHPLRSEDLGEVRAEFNRVTARLHHEDTMLCLQTSVCVGADSFLILALSISLSGSSATSSPSGFFPIILSVGGLITSLIHCGIGLGLQRRIRYWMDWLRTLEAETTDSSALSEYSICVTSRAGAHATTLFARVFPLVLSGLWLVIVGWLFARR